jgi:hypothetical protein
VSGTICHLCLRPLTDARNPINTGICLMCALRSGADFGVSAPIPYAPYSTWDYKGLHGVPPPAMMISGSVQACVRGENSNSPRRRAIPRRRASALSRLVGVGERSSQDLSGAAHGLLAQHKWDESF